MTYLAVLAHAALATQPIFVVYFLGFPFASYVTTKQTFYLPSNQHHNTFRY